MKTVVDYLKKNKQYKHDIMGFDFELELGEYGIILKANGDEWLLEVSQPYHEIHYAIQDILDEHKIEIRFCEICGKPFDAGFTADDGGCYCCEDCFEDTMNKDYGKGNWRPTEEMGENGGYYEYLNSDGVWEDTGLYYTEWN